ncbi:hypothetical protein B7O87_00405 [Cylindrospermopsis raciborskii CENA303]|uniref:Uncharacterized protein n=2 Tax=Cylindrospermopsis raciborskii TaxID=77022 RepID=A0A1X4GJ93_9CYAN|nr:MgtC/SapB family protein [Cylindrospermopsis raciborskii]NLQ05460.1 MgtC/SapB family protein [Cylindrospermopsis raciborskii MVCC19]OHY32264.1 hypothetical protein BCV64_12365 [Cylindrospermopsis raciborskii MVCC14]OPH08821.1 hypothetical protein CENA302_14975 [Cylindrospermopsis raciborskii CENA302]OSO97269.1 hypothetical protein B7O87_00405 [Cylindrospermopsis raciborskii CENA303]
MSLIKIFKIVYLVGIVLSGVLTFVSSDKNNTEISKLVWLVGVSHVFVLAMIGFRMERSKDKAAAGLRVQTSGYLHTLIGFSGALFQLDPQNLLATIVVPLSYALFTSIIGWFFGGELVNEFDGQPAGGITNEAEILIREFQSFADSLSAIHKQYIQKIKDASDSFESQLQKVGAAYERMVDTQEVQFDRLSKKQSELLAQLEDYQKRFIDSQNSCYGEMDNAIQESINSSNKLNASVDALTSALSTKELFSITSNFVYLSEQTKVASDNMGQVATTSKNVAKYLEESKILIDQLEKLLSSINSYRR